MPSALIYSGWLTCATGRAVEKVDPGSRDAGHFLFARYFSSENDKKMTEIAEKAKESDENFCISPGISARRRPGT